MAGRDGIAPYETGRDMSLICDKFFWLALTRDEGVTGIVGKEIYNPYRPEHAERADKVPYVIIQFMSLTSGGTKDIVEGQYDNVIIHILCVGNDRDELGRLTQAVREAVRNAWEGGVSEEETGFSLTDYGFSAGEVVADPTKPCVFQTLQFSCETLPSDE